MNINIDIADIVDEFTLNRAQSEEILKRTIDDLTINIHYQWVQMAQRHLRSTRNDYLRGLLLYEEGRFKNVIVLTGELNNMLENGAGAFDMKLGFSRGKRVKYSKDGGWYLTVPFRFGVPTTLGEASAFANVMPQDIYDIIRKGNNGKPIQADQLDDLDAKKGTNYSVPKSRWAVTNLENKRTFREYTHKHSIFEGMKKNNDPAGNSYVSFRRASSKSDPDSWVHSGLMRYDLAGKAIQSMNVEAVIENAIDDALIGIGVAT